MLPSPLVAVRDLSLGESDGQVSGAAASSARVRELIEVHADFVWRVLRRLGLPADAAEDAAQRVFLVVSQRIDTISPGAEQAFLFRTAMHIAARARRSVGRRREDLVMDAGQDEADGAPSAEELLDRSRARELLDEALGRMDADARAVFILFELEERSMLDIAEMLELAPGTVASRLRRGARGVRSVPQESASADEERAMSDPVRFRDAGSAWEKEVLAAADERAPDGLREALHTAVLGGTLVAGVGVVSGAGTASTASAVTTAGAASAAKTSSVLASVGLVKWVGVVAVGAAVTVGAREVLVRPSVATVSTRTPSVLPAVVPEARSQHASSLPALAAPTPGAPAPETSASTALPVPSVPVSTPAPRTSAPSMPVDDVTTFAREVGALDTARADLRQGDTDAAITTLNRYELDYPHGRLRPEALAVRIQAYAARRDVTRVTDLAAQFLTEYPSHPFAERLKVTHEGRDLVAIP